MHNYVRTIRTAFCVIIYLSALIGNITFLYVFGKCSAMRKETTNLYLENIAAVNLCAALFIPVAIAEYYLQNWPFGTMVCKLMEGLLSLNLFATTLFLAVIATDR